MLGNINHITLAVSDLEKSFAFYTEVLGLKPKVKWKRGAYLTLGDTWIALNQDSSVSGTDRADYSHIAFTCKPADFQDLRNKLLDYGCREWSDNTSEGDSFYFLDPDGHKFELHVGDLHSRLRDMEANPWDVFEFFD